MELLAFRLLHELTPASTHAHVPRRCSRGPRNGAMKGTSPAVAGNVSRVELVSHATMTTRDMRSFPCDRIVEIQTVITLAIVYAQR